MSINKISYFIILIFFILAKAEKVSANKLLQPTDFTYLGAFRVPQGDLGGPQYHGLSYGGSVITFNPPNGINGTNGSLFIVGHDYDQQVAEISIPTVKLPNNGSDIINLATASVLQNLSDITEGNLYNIKFGGATETDNHVKIGGLLVSNNKLLGTAYNYYDAGYTAVLSHFTSTLNLNTKGDFSGMFQVGSLVNTGDNQFSSSAGFVAGYMAPIPAAYQGALGGSVLTGQADISVIGRTSWGPSAFAFNPSKLGIDNPVVISPLVYYPLNNVTYGTNTETLGLWSDSMMANQYTTVGDNITGVIFPSSTKSVIFTGLHGTQSCYGYGNTTGFAGGISRTTNVSNEEMIAYMNNNNTDLYPCGNGSVPRSYLIGGGSEHQCCYDPLSANPGAHGYPYVSYAWAYNVDDLVAAKSGSYVVTQSDFDAGRFITGIAPNNISLPVGSIVMPWNLKPYAVWNFNLPTTQKITSVLSGSSTYDEATHRLYVSQVGADNDDSWGLPLIHVFQINIPSANPFYSILDFTSMVSNWFYKGSAIVSDLNSDNIVNAKDLGIAMSKWN